MAPENDVSWVAKLVGAAAGVFAAVFGVWKHTHHRIDGAYKVLELKADKVEVLRSRDMIEKLFDQQRDDRAALVAELRNTNELLREFTLGMTRELAERPTREELVERLQALKGGAA